jgi:PAS domain S-box-containing protein
MATSEAIRNTIANARSGEHERIALRGALAASRVSVHAYGERSREVVGELIFDTETVMSRNAIVGAVALLVAAQAVLIVALLVSRARRRETVARNDAILRALPDMMFVQTRDGIYVDYSAKDESILIVPPSQFLGKSMRQVLPPAMAEMFEGKIRQLFNGAEQPVVAVYDVPFPGDVRHFEARMVRLEADRILSIVRDVTVEKRSAAELQKAQLELFRASKLATLGEFAGSIAHELAQPLTAIIANSHASLRLLDRDSTDLPEVRRSLYEVIECGKVASDVIHHTRHLFGHGDPEQRPVDLADIVNEVCTMVANMLQERRVTLDLKLDASGRVIRGDRVQLRQVILNLISNGIQAMEQVGETSPRRLTISTTVDALGRACLTVSDTGIGLANVDRERLFSESYTTKPDGMGWGLSISRSIIEAHGGRLWAEPNSGGGASFSFTLPLPSWRTAEKNDVTDSTD